MQIKIDEKEELLMRIVHYFVTEENYTPIVVNGVKDEIWLQKTDGPYKIIRINGNYIHNNEQYEFDLFKIKNVMRQVKRKTLSFSMNTLNILLNVGENVKLEEDKNIASISVKEEKDLEVEEIKETFPRMKDSLLSEEKGLELIFDVTNQINQKTEKENKIYETIFKKKKIVVTNVLILINVVVFILTAIMSHFTFDDLTLLNMGALNASLVRNGQIYRLFTSAFLHGGFLHILFNMYALYVIGTQVENFMGKGKYLILYVISLLSASLMSAVLSPYGYSVGASGAIFGLLGALLYFGYYYRVYLGQVLRNQIIPLILLNLLFGFMMPGIDNAAHIGGLIGGLFCAMALGVQKKEMKQEKINGFIVLGVYLAFLLYLLFFR